MLFAPGAVVFVVDLLVATINVHGLFDLLAFGSFPDAMAGVTVAATTPEASASSRRRGARTFDLRDGFGSASKVLPLLEVLEGVVGSLRAELRNELRFGLMVELALLLRLLLTLLVEIENTSHLLDQVHDLLVGFHFSASIIRARVA